MLVRTILAAAVMPVLAVLPLPAMADGDPSLHYREVAVPLFAGGYIGLNAGAAWGNSSFSTNPGCPPLAVDATFCNDAPDPSAANGAAVAASGTGDLSSRGFTGGIQGGYNWQHGNIVFGGEGDFGAFNLRKSASPTGVFPFPFLGTAYALNESMSTDWLITLRGRLGYTVAPHLLLYATAGVALTDFSFSSSYSDNAIDATFPGGTGAASISTVRTGWAVGGGGEWMLDSRWSVKAEYLYLDFGSTDLAVATSNTADYTQTMVVDADLLAQVARVGINYRP
ncbi:MAG: outer membrane beta-barrel protein [Hyphomicrobium sp.]|nr:outer membrane beta-barrel protein [Hyphomicrobium sp.]